MKYILTDIEGTTTSISFVHDVLFPYSKEKMKSFILENQHQEKVAHILNTIPGNLENKIEQLKTWINEDKKEKALKDIQGLIWENGYLSGDIKGHVYPEVKDKLTEWKKNGFLLGVYSSGSIHAQKLLFKYSIDGNLDDLFSNNFDTSIGHKRDENSYVNIIKALNLPASEILFLSDIKEELDAAKKTGMSTIQLDRLNKLDEDGHQLVKNFNQIKF